MYRFYIVMVLFYIDKMSEEKRMGEKEALVVASKVKNYIKEQSELKCSSKVIDALSDKIRVILDNAIESAKNDKRKTVQERDV